MKVQRFSSGRSWCLDSPRATDLPRPGCLQSQEPWLKSFSCYENIIPRKKSERGLQTNYRYIQIRLVHPLRLTLTKRWVSNHWCSYCSNENTHPQKLQLHSSMPPKLRWQADSQLLAPVVRPTQIAVRLTVIQNSRGQHRQWLCEKHVTGLTNQYVSSYVSKWSIAQNRSYIGEDQMLQFDSDWKFVKRF